MIKLNVEAIRTGSGKLCVTTKGGVSVDRRYLKAEMMAIINALYDVDEGETFVEALHDFIN